MFRMLTEDHTFFYHERVGDRVLSHRMAFTMKELLKKAVYPGARIRARHHFDVIRTKMEAYSQAWEMLHQLQASNPGTTNTAVSTTSSENPEQRYVNMYVSQVELLPRDYDTVDLHNLSI